MKEKKVLVADHSEACNLLTQKYLQDLGVMKDHIVVVKDGNEALAKTQQELFDLIILSPYKLGTDAAEIARQIKTRFNENAPKIIEYTSGIFNHQKNEIFDTVIFKPTTKSDFSKEILALLQK